jgi:hypothetical protein
MSQRLSLVIRIFDAEPVYRSGTSPRRNLTVTLGMRGNRLVAVSDA